MKQNGLSKNWNNVDSSEFNTATSVIITNKKIIISTQKTPKVQFGTWLEVKYGMLWTPKWPSISSSIRKLRPNGKWVFTWMNTPMFQEILKKESLLDYATEVSMPNFQLLGQGDRSLEMVIERVTRIPNSKKKLNFRTNQSKRHSLSKLNCISTF